jgi:hypothetical protein
MLGRLSLFLHGSDLRAIRIEVGPDSAPQAWLDNYKWGQYADGLFRDVLKFDTVGAIDISDYEGYHHPGYRTADSDRSGTTI